MLESTNDCIESNDSTNCFIKLIDFGYSIDMSQELTESYI